MPYKRIRKKLSSTSKAGLPPGSLIHIGEETGEDVRITLIEYNSDEYSERIITDIEDCYASKDNNMISWINIDGLHNPDLIEKLGSHFGLHHLLLEDIMNTQHRPKVEEFDDIYFVTLRMLSIDPNDDDLLSEQLSIILGNNWLLSFQQHTGDVFDNLRTNLKEGKGQLRKRKHDYLMYRLMDTVVDNYFYVTDHFTERVEQLEDEVLNDVKEDPVIEIQHLRRELLSIKRAVMPLREVLVVMQNETSNLFAKTTYRYLRDVYEHVIQSYENIEAQQQSLTGITDLHLNRTSYKMNQVMQVLTIISTIFIPLTFIAGIYGMNFENMPELSWKYSYPIVWILMGILALIMIFYFKRKKWL